MEDVCNQERELIQAIFSRLRSASSLSAGFRSVKESTPGLQSSANHLFFGGFDFVFGLTALLDGLRTALDTCKWLGLKCSPRMVDHLDLPSGDGVVVLRYEGCANPPPPRIPAQHRIPAPALQTFIQEMRTLLAAEAGHPALLRGREAWRISEDGSCILLDEWEKLRRFDAQETALAESILRALELELREAPNGEEPDDNPLFER